MICSYLYYYINILFHILFLLNSTDIKTEEANLISQLRQSLKGTEFVFIHMVFVVFKKIQAEAIKTF